MPLHYFLGANTPSGFYSYYDHLLAPELRREVIIVKGSPGCGKSTFIRTVAGALENAGFCAEYVPCSGDPDSLDAMVCPALGAAIVDGTAPHERRTQTPQNNRPYLPRTPKTASEALFPARPRFYALSPQP